MTTQMVDGDAAAVAVRVQVSKNWWILLVQGIIAVLLGLWLLFNPPAMLTAVMFVIGIFLLVGGVIDIFGAFTGKSGNRHWYWELLGGCLTVIVGLILMVQPLVAGVLTISVITLFLGIGAALAGIFYIVGAIMMRKEIHGEIWMILWGLLLFLLGIWAIFNLNTATLLYVMVIAFLLIIGGIGAIFGSFRLRSLSH